MKAHGLGHLIYSGREAAPVYSKIQRLCINAYLHLIFCQLSNTEIGQLQLLLLSSLKTYQLVRLLLQITKMYYLANWEVITWEVNCCNHCTFMEKRPRAQIDQWTFDLLPLNSKQQCIMTNNFPPRELWLKVGSKTASKA